MLALGTEWLFVREGHRLRFLHAGNREPFHPIDRVVAQDELSLWLDIIENCHAVVANHDQLLLLVGMKPAYENMASDTAPELQRCDRDVRNPMVEVTPPLGGDGHRPLFEKIENGGDIVGCKAPEDILFCPEPTQVETVRTYVVELPQSALGNQALELRDCGMIPEQMADHQ